MTKIIDFKEKEKYTIPLMIKSCTKGTTQKGSPYLNLVLQDSSGSIDAKLWDVKTTDEEAAVVGNVVNVNCEVLLYNHALQLRVNSLVSLDQNTLDMSEYLQTSSYSETVLRNEIKDLILSIQNTNLKTLVIEMFKKVDKRFFVYPAASKIHHGYVGGLAEHTLGMAKTAKAICSLYPTLNYDLLLSGVLVHDMGKTCELGGLISGEYSTEGKLIGHISICHGWLMEASERCHLENAEETLLLRHMILSHHGKLEFGSPVLPEIKEAEVLSYIDNLDARMNTLNQALSQVKPGEWTAKLFALEGRQFYKPKI